MPISTFPLPSSAISPRSRHPHGSQKIPSPTNLPTLNPKKQFKSKHKNKTIRHRLLQLCKEGRPDEAHRLLDAIINPSTVLWNTIIIGYICNDLPNDALRVYFRMRRSSGTICDLYTYSSVLKACAAARQFRTGKAVHCHILRCQLIPNIIVSNSLLNMYSNCMSTTEAEMDSLGSEFGQYDLVRRVFDEMLKQNVVSWNILVSWYVKKGRFFEAIKQLKCMLELGVKPTVISFVNIFPAISSARDVFTATVVYAMLLKLGNRYSNNMFSVSSGISMFAELGCVHFAQIIFDRSLERNAEVWNTITTAYIQNDRPLEALHLFLEALKTETTVIDNVTLVLALNAVSQLQDLKLGQQLHGYAIKTQDQKPFFPPPPITLFNSIIAMYSRCGSVESAFTTFEKMTKRDVFSWNTIVTALVQNNLDFEGLRLVYEMQKQGFSIDSITATAILSASSTTQNLQIGKQIHAYLIRRDINVNGINSYLIEMYAQCDLIKISRRVFENRSILDQDPATWNAMISGYTRHDLIGDAFAIFKLMVMNHYEGINSVTISSILPVCSSLNLASILHAFAVRRFLNQNPFVATALITLYSKTGALISSERIFSESPSKSSVTFTAMILGYAQHGMGKKAVSLFHSLHDHGIRPNAVAFVAVLCACSYAGLVNEGLEVFESMEKVYGIEPTVEHYSCIVDLLGRAGRVLEAYEFVEGLGEKGNVLGIWRSLLGACKVHGENDLGMMISEKISSFYREEEKWRFEPGCSSIEVKGFVKSFIWGDQKHARSGEICKMLEELHLQCTSQID